MTGPWTPTNAPRKPLRPRSHDRPHLRFLGTTFQMLMYLSVGFAVFFGVIAIAIGDSVGVQIAAALLGSALLCGIGWVVVYIARTLDDIGYAVGAPAEGLPMPPAARTQTP